MDHTAPHEDGGHVHDVSDKPGSTPLRTRLLLSLALAVPVVALGMVPAWQFPGWQWVSLVLTAPIVLWGGWPFHRATIVNARHGAMTMDTLITLGTMAAFGWSVWALFFGSAGRIGLTAPACPSSASASAMSSSSAPERRWPPTASSGTVAPPWTRA